MEFKAGIKHKSITFLPLSSKILFMVLKLVLASKPAGKLPLLVHVAAILVL